MQRADICDMWHSEQVLEFLYNRLLKLTSATSVHDDKMYEWIYSRSQREAESASEEWDVDKRLECMHIHEPWLFRNDGKRNLASKLCWFPTSFHSSTDERRRYCRSHHRFTFNVWSRDHEPRITMQQNYWVLYILFASRIILSRKLFSLHYLDVHDPKGTYIHICTINNKNLNRFSWVYFS